MEIKVLGVGCKNCKKLYEEVLSVVSSKGVSANVTHITDPQVLVELGVFTVPALIVDGKLVSAGKVLSKNEIETILEGKPNFGGCSCGGNC